MSSLNALSGAERWELTWLHLYQAKRPRSS